MVSITPTGAVPQQLDRLHFQNVVDHPLPEASMDLHPTMLSQVRQCGVGQDPLI